MFAGFFYRLRDYGVPISPTSFLRLQQALAEGLVATLEDFYVVARAIMVKRERHFDTYDKVFANYFAGQAIDEDLMETLEIDLQQMLNEWLTDPLQSAFLSDEEKAAMQAMTPEEVWQYFLDRLKEQTKRHDGGNRWIGTGGTSPVGHSGYHPGGMRVGGVGRGHSAVKVALDRRYIDYSDTTTLTAEQLGEALRTLRQMAPVGPKDQLNVDKTIYETVRNAGEIELVFDHRLRDKLTVWMFIDNGGWSMTPYIKMTQALFAHAQDSFKRLRTFFFHNCIYDTVWEDPQRMYHPIKLEELLRGDRDTRIIIVGDASMGPYELVQSRGAIDPTTYQRRAGINCLIALRDQFRHSVWINPINSEHWLLADGASTISMINEIFDMVDLTLNGIEEAVRLLTAK